MKKIVSILLSLVLSISVCSTAFAAEVDNVVTDDEAFVSVWTNLRNSGDLFVDEDGYLCINTDNMFTDMQGYDMVLTAVSNCNIGIESGYLVVDATSVEVESVYSAQKLLEDNTVIAPIISGGCDLQSVNDYNDKHGCNVEALDLLGMCQDNYDTLSDYYDSMIRAAMINPNINPYSATVGFWVGKVMEGGDWDYKSVPGFAPFYVKFCCYYDNTWNHITSEYIGNFNYGYTGSLLFDLNTLHFGSLAVAKFDPKDKEDWPAIDKGYGFATA